MYWVDNPSEPRYQVPEDIIDAGFRIHCRHLPADYASALQSALTDRLPWLDDEPLAGIYLSYGAESGNGWRRPDGSSALIHLSGRARLNLRLPKARAQQTLQLQGETIEVLGHPCEIASGKVRLLSAHTTLFTRHLQVNGQDDEAAFLEDATRMLEKLGIKPPGILAGLRRSIATPKRRIETRSLMVEGLTPQESVRIQQYGLGEWRKLGCGLFVPHKSTAAVSR